MGGERDSQSPAQWGRTASDTRRRHRRSSSSRRRSSKRSRSPVESRRSRRERTDSRSPSRRRSRRRREDENGITEEKNKQTHPYRSKSNADEIPPDDRLEPHGPNWWEQHPPYASSTRKQSSSRGARGRGSSHQVSEEQADYKESIGDAAPGQIAVLPTDRQSIGRSSNPTGMPNRPFAANDMRSQLGRGDPAYMFSGVSLPTISRGQASWAPTPAPASSGYPGWRPTQQQRFQIREGRPPPPPNEEEAEQNSFKNRHEDDLRGQRSLGYPPVGFRNVMSQGSWPQGATVPGRFSVPGGIDPNLLARHGRPPVAFLQRMAPLGYGVAGRGWRPQVATRIPSQGPLLMAHQAKRRAEATGRYVEGDLEGVIGPAAMTQQDRQEEELVEELQEFLDLELSRTSKCHSFFSRIAEKVENSLLSNHALTTIESVVPPEARVVLTIPQSAHHNKQPSSQHIELSNQIALSKQTSQKLQSRNIPKPFTIKSLRGQFLLSNDYQQQQQQQIEMTPSSKKLKKQPQNLSDLLPNVILSNSLNHSVREMPFNILEEGPSDETDTTTTITADDDRNERKAARLMQFISACRSYSAIHNKSFDIKGWFLPTSKYYPTACNVPNLRCSTFPSISQFVSKNEELNVENPFCKDQRITEEIQLCDLSIMKVVPDYLSVPFSIGLNQNQLDIMSFSQIELSENEKVTDCWKMEAALVTIINQTA